MRPIRVDFQAFGPYKTAESVDFEKLSSKGLFLITGDTGTGKTTILDAITFALYGKSSGGGRNDFEQMRCKYADENVPTYVRFEFENNGHYFVFERKIEKKRVNYQKSYNVMQRDANGEWQVLFDNTKESDINKKAVEIIGLEYSQFIQVIILPQGKFEEFLVSSSEDKANILTSIFGEEKWQVIAKLIYDKAYDRVEELKTVKTALKLRLNEEGCESIEELRELIETKKNEARILKMEFDEADFTSIIKENQEKLALISRFEALDLEEKREKELASKKEERAEWEDRLKNAKRAAKIRTEMDNATALRKILEERIIAEDKIKVLASECKNKVDALQGEYEQHIALDKQYDDKKSRVIMLESKKADYEGITSANKELEEIEKLERNAFQDEKKAKDACDRCDEAIIDLKKEYEELKQEHERLVDLRFAGMVSELAKELEDGKPCPVCGSTSHNVSISICEETTSKEQVDIKQKEVNIKYEELEAAGEKKTNAEAYLKSKHDEVEKAHGKVIEISAKVSNMKKNMLDGINSLEELLTEIGRLSDEISLYNERKTEIENALKVANEENTENSTKALEASKETKNARANSEDADKVLELSIKENGFKSEEEVKTYLLNDEEEDTLTRGCADYDATVKNNHENLCKLREELKSSVRPDKGSCEKSIEEATTAREQYAKESGILQNMIDKLSEKEVKISKESEGMEKKISDAESDLLVAKKVCGYTGIGLQRYVLGIMFSSVVSEANRMLELFNGGRYRLFRTDEKKDRSNKSGLELKVFDKYSDDENGRFVHSLSGGEKFLTSLALSIGMSSVARRGGIKIEAMFIDEGFGTLDNSCVEDAMNILDAVKRANGVVGIISHMEILREKIPTKLVAVDDGKGSHLVKTIG